MTFGKVKSIIEKNLLESYKNEAAFKRNIREFRHNVLNNKSLSKAYSVYDQLSTPQGLSESDAKEFLQEGISLLQKVLPTIKMPKSMNESINNLYSDIDTLVYTKTIHLRERVEAKKNIISTLMKPKTKVEESINIPVSSMVKIANKTLMSFIENMDESSKKEFFQLISEDNKTLENKFEELKSRTIGKLQNILEQEKENEVKDRINETIEKLKDEKFDQMNFLRLKDLESSI